MKTIRVVVSLSIAASIVLSSASAEMPAPRLAPTTVSAGPSALDFVVLASLADGYSMLAVSRLPAPVSAVAVP
jgi:hypothetical protein